MAGDKELKTEIRYHGHPVMCSERPWIQERIKNGLPTKIGFPDSHGRFPTNVIFYTGVTAHLMHTKSGATKKNLSEYAGISTTGFLRGVSNPNNQYGDSGSVSRFFKVIE